jgi:mRNA interferase MazF
LADLDPARGAEANKVRPVIVVGNNASLASAARHGRGTVTIVPVTTNITRVFAFQVLLESGTGGLKAESKAQAEQIRSIDVNRLSHRLGGLSPAVLARVDDALRLHLAL